MARMRGYAAAAAPCRWTVDCAYIARQLLMFSDVGPATAVIALSFWMDTWITRFFAYEVTGGSSRSREVTGQGVCEHLGRSPEAINPH